MKNELRSKMSVIASTDIHNNDDILLDRKTFEKLKEIDIEEEEYADDEEDEDEEKDLKVEEILKRRQYTEYTT
ncbi:MAG: hypothetical protein QM771_11150 [Nitrospira sp.]